MTMPESTYRDLMHRTITNYEFVRDNAQKDGPYEVTQLVNSFVAVVGYPRERAIGDLLKAVSIEKGRDLGLPPIPVISSNPNYRADSVADQATMLRNAAAHGRIKFSADENSRQIGAITFSDENRARDQRTSIALTIETVEQILYAFRNIAEYLFQQASQLNKTQVG